MATEPGGIENSTRRHRFEYGETIVDGGSLAASSGSDTLAPMSEIATISEGTTTLNEKRTLNDETTEIATSNRTDEPDFVEGD